MIYENNKVKEIKIAYIGGGSRGWAWGLMSDLVSAEDISGDVYLYDINLAAAKNGKITFSFRFYKLDTTNNNILIENESSLQDFEIFNDNIFQIYSQLKSFTRKFDMKITLLNEPASKKPSKTIENTNNTNLSKGIKSKSSKQIAVENESKNPSNKEVASFIYKIFKTIRKYSGSSVAITQDISDVFSLENGIYGKSILNNSSIKTFFALEEENIKILSEFANLSEKEKIEIKSLKRGEALMFVGEDHILTKIECSEEEKKIVEGENNIEKDFDSY